MELPREFQLSSATHRAAENVMAHKHALIEVDKRRQSIRQASRELENPKAEEHVTLLTGSLMIKLPKSQVKEIIKNDLKELDIESNCLRSQLKEDVNMVRELEMHDPIRGFDLTPLSTPEMAAVGQVLGRNIMQ